VGCAEKSNGFNGKKKIYEYMQKEKKASAAATKKKGDRSCQEISGCSWKGGSTGTDKKASNFQ
jgi:hypothetical protein